MRVLALLLLPLAFGATASPSPTSTDDVVVPSSVPKEYHELYANLTVQSYEDPEGEGECRYDPTRNPDTCDCYRGLIEPHGAEGWCCCPDDINTDLVIPSCQPTQCDPAKCQCKPKHSYYNKHQKKCLCKDGWVPEWGANGKLKCHRPTPPSSSTSSSPPTGSAHPKRHAQRSFEEAVQNHIEEEGSDGKSTALEQFLGCGVDEKACEIGGSWTCTDVVSTLSSCGGCPGDVRDCASLPGVDQVRCDQGRCIIDSCRRGYALKNEESVNGTAVPAFCLGEKTHSWLHFQHAG